MLGPDIKSVIDWTTLIDWGAEGIKHKQKISGQKWTDGFFAVLFGQGGSTDFILGNKNLFNYGLQDFNFTRKHEPALKIDYSGKKVDGKQAKGLKIVMGLIATYVVAQIGFILSIRLLYMGLGVDTKNEIETAARKALAGHLIEGQKNLGIRLMAGLKLAEVLWFLHDEVYKEKNHFKKIVAKIEKNALEAVDLAQGDLRLSENSRNSFVLIPVRKQFEQLLKDESDDLLEESKKTGKNVGQLLSLPSDDSKEGQQDSREIVRSNAPVSTINPSYFEWGAGESFKFNVNPKIYAGDQTAEFDSAFLHNPDKFHFMIQEDQGKGGPSTDCELILKNDGFSLDYEDPKRITFRNGSKGDNPLRSRFALTPGAIALDCGKDAGGPSLEINTSKNGDTSRIVLSTNIRPGLKNNNLEKTFNTSFFMDKNDIGLYGGPVDDVQNLTKAATGVIQVKSDSVVINFHGSKIVLDQNGISLETDKKISFKGKEGIDLISGNSSIKLNDNEAKIASGSNSISIAMQEIKAEGTAINFKADATFKAECTLLELICKALKTSKAALYQNKQ